MGWQHLQVRRNQGAQWEQELVVVVVEKARQTDHLRAERLERLRVRRGAGFCSRTIGSPIVRGMWRAAVAGVREVGAAVLQHARERQPCHVNRDLFSNYATLYPVHLTT